MDDFVPPTEEEFVMKLVHSALLDRVSINSNNIEFINDFIFGILIGDAVIEGDLKAAELSDKYVSLICTAYSVESQEKRERLYELIDQQQIKFSVEQRITLEMKMLGRLQNDYIDEYISELVFKKDFNFNTGRTFLNCIFNACSFDKNNVSRTLFDGCHFIDCDFYEFALCGEENPNEESIFISCRGNEALEVVLANTEFATVEKDEEYFERLVLEQFWMIGSKAAEPRKTQRTLLKGIKQQEQANVLLAIEALISRGILRKLTYCLELNFSKLTEVKKILGR